MRGKHVSKGRGARSRRRGLAAGVMTLVLAGSVAVTSAPVSALSEPSGDQLRVVDRGDIERIDGYVAVSDGTLLRVQIDRPKAHAQVPTLLVYGGYMHLIDRAVHPDVGFQQWVMEDGYALMRATIRGTACSAGKWDFLSEQEALDASDLISWVARQEWSNGKVAMVGESYEGFEQLRVASMQPEHLVAIAPAAPFTDLYRDVAAPGGIANALTPVGLAYQMAVNNSVSNAFDLTFAGEDPDLASRCSRHQAARGENLTGSPAVQFAEHRWDDDFMRERSPGNYDIALPMLVLVSWQDAALGSRAIDTLGRMSGPVHAVLSNGDHSKMWTSSSYQDQLRAFLAFYVKGVDNGFDDEGRIQLWWETTRQPGQNPVIESTPNWTDRVPRYPAPNAQVTSLHLSAGGMLSGQPGTGAPDTYTSVPGNGQSRAHGLFPTFDPRSGSPWPTGWTLPAGEGYSLAYTSPALDKDLTALGSASVDLHLSSSTADTDVQVVLTEVRPDGQEMYVQVGWLRASHRVEDEERTEPTRPFHTHLEGDETFLEPGVPELMRVEIKPFGHVFRAGSSIRIWIEAPATTFGGRSLEPLPYVSENVVHHDAEHPSVLQLSTLPGRPAPGPRPPCELVIAQPCRPDPLAAS